MEFKPSQYQEDIYEFTKYGHGNAVISAVAGSGKSTTIINALKYIKPERRVLFLAFNNSIVEELKKKIIRENTDIKTLHSLGFSIIKYNFKEKNIEIDENKYKNKLNCLLQDYDSSFLYNKKYIKNVLKLCDLARLYLVSSKNELLKIANKHNIILVCYPDDNLNELDITLELIEWGKTSLDEENYIDYADMLYLPNVLNLKAFKYDFIIIDEAQDLSVSQMKLFMKCFKQGTRFIAVGDEKQAINGFCGSDIESFNKLKDTVNTIELPLSICYRCPKNIVKLAQKIVPNIEYSDSAIDGAINYNATINDLSDGDMVICRTSLPLIKLYFKLMSNGITSYLKGNDIGINLLDLIDNCFYEKISDILEQFDILLKTYININTESGESFENVITSQEYNDLFDKLECIKVLANGLETKDELVDRITNMFSDENKKGICLSTIHKSKGLEADNVYILDKKLMPSKCAKQEWEQIQEQNLIYVAYTRAKKVLGFINS